MFRPFSVLLIATALTACGGDDGQGTSIAINAAGENGGFVAGVDGANGEVSIDVPGGFSGKIKLPAIKLDAGDFDMNGVHLYPGSTISSLNIDARDGGATREEDAVRVSFESPATPDKVRAWFLDKLTAQAGFKIKADGTGLSGTTDDNQPFRLDLAPAAADRARGTIVIGG